MCGGGFGGRFGGGTIWPHRKNIGDIGNIGVIGLVENLVESVGGGAIFGHIGT